jgi:PAS domain S-box-containing protein
MERDLRTTSSILQTLFDNLDGVFFSIDLLSHQVTHISAAFEAITGYSREMVYANLDFWRDIIYPDDLPAITNVVSQLIEGMPIVTTCRILRPDNEVRWVESKIKPTCDVNGNVIRLDGLSIDITERRRAARLAAAGEVSTGIAHQINNPLTTVIIESHLLLKQFDPDDPRATTAAEIKDAAYRAANIVQRLLNVGRIHSEQTTSLDIHGSLQQALKLVRPQMQLQEIELSCEFTEAPLPVVGAAEQLQDVWINLLLNARDAVLCRAQGQIQVSTHVQDEIWAVVTISDNGEGISEENIGRIFDPFFTTKANGTGLGLPLCFEAVQNHHGQLQVSSVPGEGTIFKVKLPLERMSDG